MRYRNHIKGYYVGYKPAEILDKSFTYKTIDVDSKADPFEMQLTSLEPLTRYVIVVKAFNRKGAGPASMEAYVKTNDIGKFCHPPILTPDHHVVQTQRSGQSSPLASLSLSNFDRIQTRNKMAAMVVISLVVLTATIFSPFSLSLYRH